MTAVRRLLPVLLLATAGCTWIKLTDAGADVVQAEPDEVDGCQQVGTVTTNTQNRVLLERGRGKVAEELIVMARNEAATLGGNTIVPRGPMVDGRQDFNVYRCSAPIDSP